MMNEALTESDSLPTASSPYLPHITGVALQCAQFGHCAACWQAAECDLAFDPAHPCCIMYAHDDNMLATSTCRTHQDPYSKSHCPNLRLSTSRLCRRKADQMTEPNHADAEEFLKTLDACMQQGRCAEAFFHFLTSEDALRQKVCARRLTMATCVSMFSNFSFSSYICHPVSWLRNCCRW